MIELTVRATKTYFDGPKSEIKVMLRCLRLKNKSGKWAALRELRRVGWYGSTKNRAKRREKIESIEDRYKWIKFYERRGDTFYSGLLGRVKRFLKKKGIEFRIVDKRRPIPEFKPIKRFRFNDEVELRPEQIAATNAALEKGRGILYCATNAGKTEIACAIVREFRRQLGKTPRVMFLVHRTSLVEQTAKRFRRHLTIPIYILRGGKKHLPTSRGVVIATVQTASNLLSELETFQEQCDILIIDEFHLNKAGLIAKTIRDNLAPQRYGLSGTIDERSKAKMLHYTGITGPILYVISNKLLVKLGRSAKPYVTFREVNDYRIGGSKKFAEAYRLGIIENEVRNKMIVKDTLRHLEKGRKVLVTISRLEHGKILKHMLQNKTDLRIEFLQGSSSIEMRKKVVRKFELGKVAVIIGSSIFDVGVDLPAITGWVNAASGKGWELVLQRLGRVLRKKLKGKNEIHISDYVDKHNDYLFKHSLHRINHYLKEEVVKVKII